MDKWINEKVQASMEQIAEKFGAEAHSWFHKIHIYPKEFAKELRAMFGRADDYTDVPSTYQVTIWKDNTKGTKPLDDYELAFFFLTEDGHLHSAVTGSNKRVVEAVKKELSAIL